MTSQSQSSPEPPTAQDTDASAVSGGGLDGVQEELSRLAQLPVEEHVAVFDRIHQQLRGRLADAGDRGEDQPTT